MCVLPAYMSCIRWSLMPPPKNLGSFPRASQHMSCVAVSVHVFLPFSRLAAIFSPALARTHTIRRSISGSKAHHVRPLASPRKLATAGTYTMCVRRQMQHPACACRT